MPRHWTTPTLSTAPLLDLTDRPYAVYLIDWITLQSSAAVSPPTRAKNPPARQVSRTVRAELRSCAPHRVSDPAQEPVNWPGQNGDCCRVPFTSFDGTIPVHPRSTNGGGRFRVPANVRWHTGRWQSGHRRSSSSSWSWVPMAGWQATGSYGRFQRVSGTEGCVGAGVCSREASSDPREHDLRGARNRLWRATAGSRHQHSHAGRSRGWNHGALSNVPHRLCQGN